MAEPQEALHLTKACDLQRPDKSWAPGSLFVYATRAVWRPAADAGGAGEQGFPLKDLSEFSQPRSNARCVRCIGACRGPLQPPLTSCSQPRPSPRADWTPAPATPAAAPRSEAVDEEPAAAPGDRAAADAALPQPP